MKPFWASPRRLHRQPRRAFIALARPLTTPELVKWAYPELPPTRWHRWNVRRSLRHFGYEPVGMIGKTLLWDCRKKDLLRDSSYCEQRIHGPSWPASVSAPNIENGTDILTRQSGLRP